jgi:mRNA interferase MazF
VIRGEIWLAEVGSNARPVLMLTRNEVIDVRRFVTIAEITTQRRGLAVEVDVPDGSGVTNDASVINCDGLHTVAQSTLTRRLGEVDQTTLARVCKAVAHAIGC